MLLFNLTFFLNGHRPVQSSIRPRQFKGEWTVPANQAYFCPKCGDVWARVTCEGSDFFVVNIVPCAQHPMWLATDVPGTLMQPLWPEWNAAVPDELIPREFQLHLKAWDRLHEREGQ